MKFHRLTALTLAILTALLSACGSTAIGTEITTSDTTVQPEETASALEARMAIEDDLPEKDFGGRDFVILTYDTLKPNIYADAANGDVINDAVFARNQTVEERFNVKISTLSQLTYGDTTTFAKTTVLAGDDAFSLVDNHVVSLSGAVLNGVFMNWYDLDYIDFSNPWWSKSTVEDLTYHDKTFFAIGDLSLSAIGGTYAVFYDKKDAKDWGITDLYATVNDGKWTVDYIRTITKDIYQDLNANGTRDADDYFGYCFTPQSSVNAYFWSFGGKIYEKQKDGSFAYKFKSEKTTDIVEKLYALMFESEGVNCFLTEYRDTNVHFAPREKFTNGQCLFVGCLLSYAVDNYRFREGEYGILPYPKYDEAQEEYKTMVDGSHGVQAIPMTVTDTEFVGIITEALNAESYKQVTPAYYDIALKIKYTSDTESAEIIDRIVENRVFDFGYVYDNWKGVSFLLQGVLGENRSKDFESYYSSKSTTALEYYQQIFDFFDGKS